MDVPGMVLCVFAILFGLSVGSFLNVLIYRLPRRESIAFPASHCPDCGTPIRPYDNIPLLGFLLLGGRCRSCRVPISVMYPIIEGLTGALFGVMFLLHGPSMHFIADVTLGCILIVVFCVDLRHMIIPDRLNLAGGIIGLSLATVFGSAGIIRAVGGALAGLAILGGMALLGWILYRRESVGQGDFKLVAVTGIFLGPLGNSIALALAILVGGIWGMARLAIRRSIAGEEVPFGTFIAVGCFLFMIFRDPILMVVRTLFSPF